MPVTTDFAGTETLAETKSRLGTLLTAYGYDSSGYSTWGDARTDLNSALTAIEETTISDGELASSFRSKLNALNAWSDYPAGGKVPNLVFDFEDEYYRANDTETTFGDSITFSRASSATYVDSDGVLQTAASGVPRIGHHVWNGSAWVNEGLLHESEARTNSIRNSTMVGATAGTLDTTGSLPTNWSMSGIATSSVTVATGTESGLAYTELRVNGTPTAPVRIFLDTATGIAASAGQNWTFSTWMKLESGTLTNVDNVQVANNRYTSGGAFHSANSVFITLTSTSQRFSFPDTSIDDADGSGTIESIRPRLQFTWTSGAVDFTVRIYGPQMELGSTPSSYIPTSGSTVTRAAETLTIPAAKLPYSATAMSIQMDGRMTYADTDEVVAVNQIRWQADASNRIQQFVTTSGGATGKFGVQQISGGVVDSSQETGNTLVPGILTPFNAASRHGSTFIRGAIDGTLLPANTTPTALPDLSTTDLNLGYDYMGTIRTFRMWDQDIGDSGIQEASA
jgi:hypothetical protein